MTDSKNKRIAVASGLAVAAIAAVAVAFYLPYSASAQQVMSAQPGFWMGQGSNIASFAGNSTHVMPNITGSINIPKLINEQVKVSFSDAAKTAQGQVTGGKVIGGHIGIVQGYLVYSFIVTNPTNNTSYMVIVDAGNGSVLHKSEGFQMGSFGEHLGFGGGDGGGGGPGDMMHKFGGMMWGKHFG
jgi:hypothetical protein